MMANSKETTTRDSSSSSSSTAAATKAASQPPSLRRRKPRRLKVCYRQQQQHDQGDTQEQLSLWNLFVRLHPRTVQELHQEAAAAAAAAAATAEDEAVNSSSGSSRRRTRTRRTNSGANVDGDDGECWHISKNALSSSSSSNNDNSRGMIDFLPLAIQRILPNCGQENDDNDSSSPSQIIYASYNGGELYSSSSSSPQQRQGRQEEEAQECIDLSSCLLVSSSPEKPNTLRNNNNQKFSDDDDFVKVWALSYVPNATQVHMEPCSQTDWELIQMNAAWLEGGGGGESSSTNTDGDGSGGGLLHQVSIVYPGQVLSLCVPPPPSTGSSTSNSTSRRHCRIQMVQLRVLSGSTKGGSTKKKHAADNQIWPLLDDDDAAADDDDTRGSQEHDDDNDHNKFCCFRLVQDTEVIVAPYKEKEQDKESSSARGHVFSLYPTLQDYYADGNLDDNDDSNNGSAAVVKILADRLRHVIGSKNHHINNVKDITARQNHIITSPQRQRPPQVSLLTSMTVPPFTALVHPTILSRLILLQQQQQQQQQAAAPSDNRHDNNNSGGGEELLLVQLRAIPSGQKDDDDDDHEMATPRKSSLMMMMVVQLQESNDVPEDRIALHPLVRKALVLNLFDDQVAIHAVLGSSLSFQVQQAVQDAIHQVTQQQSQQDADQAVLRLQPIAMLHDSSAICRPMTRGDNMKNGDVDADDHDTSTDYLPPWRRPDIVGNGTTNLVVAPSTCCSKSMEKDLLERLESAVSSTANGNLPVGVGSILPLSWTNNIDQENEAVRNKFLHHYRLVMAPFKKDDNNDPVDLEPLFFFARDLPKLLRSSLLLHRQSEQVVGSGSATVWTESKSPQLPINLLPGSSIVPACLVEGRPLPSSMGQCSTLICGDSGSGKTHSALVLATVAQLLFVGSRTIYLNCRRLKDTRGLRTRDILAALDEVFKEASTRPPFCSSSSPVILILDDLDEIVPNHESDSMSGVDDSTQVQQVNPLEIEQAKMISDHLFSLMHSVMAATLSQQQHMGVMITCSHEASIPRKLLSACHAFKNPIKLPMFSNQERESLFLKSMQQYMSSCMDWKEATERLRSIDFASRTETFSPQDIKLLSFRVHQRMRSSSKDCEFAIESATAVVLESFVPANQQSASLERTSESASWDDVGGLSRAKQELIETILRPSMYRRIYQKARIRLPRGVLLFGPTGCGKSFLVPALAKKCRLPLIMCRGPELLDKYIGASEAKVRELFSRAAAAAPSILFLDELDSLAPRRGSDHTGVTDRVVNQLLTFLDGVEDTQGGGTVYVLAATSRPDKVDPALLRPGRLEKHVYVGFPEQVEDLTDVLVKMARHYNVDKTVLDEQVASGELAKKAFTMMRDAKDDVPRLSPADVKAMLNTAQILAVRESLPVLTTTTPNAGNRDAVHADEKRQEMNTICLEAHHLHEALRLTRPSLSKQEWGHLRLVYSSFLPGRNMKKTANDGSSKPPSILRTALK